ncbi:hypothetical protein FFM54_01095 [Burkholderia pseudomallei]|nr:hypothetical protein FFM54_01095 [Burkholderia pseudomallei]
MSGASRQPSARARAGVIVEQQPVADAAGHARARNAAPASSARRAWMGGSSAAAPRGAEEEGGGVIEVREP